MTTLNATRKLMRVKDDGSKVKMTFDVQINCTTGLIDVKRPAGRLRRPERRPRLCERL